MVFAGTETVEHLSQNKVLKVTFAGFDADAEESYALFPIDILARFIQGKLPTRASLYVTAAHASAVTDVVDIALQGSVDGTRWSDIASVTDADVDDGGTVAEDSAIVHGDLRDEVYRYFRVLCTTVGAGNTLTAIIHLAV